MKQKLQTLLTELNHGLVEREATLKTALLTVLAGENLVLIGPPGTGKSLIARRIADSFVHDDSNGYFEYLLTKFSTPEEIFGPLSITELKADRFKRNTAGYLPTVKIAFLDEIFKASSSILNALLTILNERVYHNGAEAQKVPMQALIAASNELPTDQEELSALYDRFLVRGFVDYVSQYNLLRLFAKEETAPALTKLTAVDLKNIETAVKFVTIPPEIVQAVQRIWIQHKETFKEDRRESLSDRRLKKVIKLLCVSAATNGRTEVDLSDVFLLKDCLWNHQDNAIKVRDLILNILQQSYQVTVATPLTTPAFDEGLVGLTEVKVPDIGDSEEFVVIDLLVKVGDTIKFEQSLISVESDKSVLEIPSHQNGTVKEIKVKLGDKISEGSLILLIETDGAFSTASTTKTQINKKSNIAVNGFKGSGTEQDPLLIQTVEDLIDLSRPDVGLKGYYFRQIADIDCSGLTSWTDIPFKGHYNGGGNTISSKISHDLFSIIQAQSSISNLKLQNLTMANTAENSHITHCGTSNFLIQNKAMKCIIHACESGNSLIIGTAIDCTITACKSGNSLIRGTATLCIINTCESGSIFISETAISCTITDCLAVIAASSISITESAFSGVASTLTKGSLVKRCFITGKVADSGIGVLNFSGIAADCSDSTVSECAVGKFTFIGQNIRWQRRITGKKPSANQDVFQSILYAKFNTASNTTNTNKPSTLKNNASIDSNPGNDDINGKDGKTVASALFKQRYFEHTLNWNFDTVWQWDDKEDRPALRSVGVGAASQQVQPAAQQANMVDLLTQQISANIWL